jgi:hypothetical protein
MATGTGQLRVAKDLFLRRSEGRARADHHCARPFPITFDELAGAAEASARSAVPLLELELAGRFAYLGDHAALGASATET